MKNIPIFQVVVLLFQVLLPSLVMCSIRAICSRDSAILSAFAMNVEKTTWNRYLHVPQIWRFVVDVIWSIESLSSEFLCLLTDLFFFEIKGLMKRWSRILLSLFHPLSRPRCFLQWQRRYVMSHFCKIGFTWHCRTQQSWSLCTWPHFESEGFMTY